MAVKILKGLRMVLCTQDACCVNHYYYTTIASIKQAKGVLEFSSLHYRTKLLQQRE